MTLEENLADLKRHARDFAERMGFTYTVLAPGSDDVLGCVYIYPARDEGHDADIANPVQVAAVQTCRGSHTHTLVDDESDSDHVYIYVQGTAGVRPASTLASCNNNPANGENPSRWRIEVIKVPVAAPQNAAVVGEPRLFTDPATGAVDGLQNQVPTPLHPSGIPWSPTPITDACHDITVYEELDLAAGACEGNGLLIDISDPADPTRIDAVADPLWAYWHGATFSNDGRYVIFTDEWGGGTAARCRATDQSPWGGDAIYEIVDDELEFRSYYKLPVAQTNNENCVTHIPSLVPVPGRDLFIQAFYQGGASLVDFEDTDNPREIGYFDRGPVSGTGLVIGGFWSTYWFNGVAYGSELARNFDVLALTPTSQISANEIAAAREVQWDRLNVQNQQRITWEPSFNVVRSYRDQLEREGNIDAKTLARVDAFIDRAEAFSERGKSSAASAQLHALANQLKGNANFNELRGGLNDLAAEPAQRGGAAALRARRPRRGERRAFACRDTGVILGRAMKMACARRRRDSGCRAAGRGRLQRGRPPARRCSEGRADTRMELAHPQARHSRSRGLAWAAADAEPHG